MLKPLPDGSNAVVSFQLRYDWWRIAIAVASVAGPVVALALRREWTALGIAVLFAAYLPAVLFIAGHYLTMIHAQLFMAARKRDGKEVASYAQISCMVRVLVLGTWSVLAMWAIPRCVAGETASIVPAVILAAAIALQPVFWTSAICWGDVRCIVRTGLFLHVAACAANTLFPGLGGSTFPLSLYYPAALTGFFLAPLLFVSNRVQARAAMERRPFA